MHVDVSVTGLIAAPLEEVAEFAGDPGNATRWYANIESVSWRTDPPVRLGSQVDFVARFLGRRLVYTYEVVALEPGRRLVMRTTDGPFPMRTTYRWAAEGDHTRMTLRNDGEPHGLAAVAAPVLQWAMRRAMRADLRRLGEVLAR